MSTARVFGTLCPARACVAVGRFGPARPRDGLAAVPLAAERGGTGDAGVGHLERAAIALQDPSQDRRGYLRPGLQGRGHGFIVARDVRSGPEEGEAGRPRRGCTGDDAARGLPPQGAPPHQHRPAPTPRTRAAEVVARLRFPRPGSQGMHRPELQAGDAGAARQVVHAPDTPRCARRLPRVGEGGGVGGDHTPDRCTPPMPSARPSPP